MRFIEIINEVNMNPTSLRSWASSSEAEGIDAGFEMELIFKKFNDDDEELIYDLTHDQDIPQTFKEVREYFESDPFKLGNEPKEIETFFNDEYFLWVANLYKQTFQKNNNDVGYKNIAYSISLSWDNLDKSTKDNLINKIFHEDEDADLEYSERMAWSNQIAWEDYSQDIDIIGEVITKIDNNKRPEELSEHSFMIVFQSKTMFDILESYGSSEWPFKTSSEGGGGRQDYFQVSRDIKRLFKGKYGLSDKWGKNTFGLTIDDTIEVDNNNVAAGGRELISPPLPLDEAIEALEILHKWGNDPKGGNSYTNQSTGLHMNMSIPNFKKLDYTKLILFMGDKYILDKFKREHNDFAQSAYGILLDTLNSESSKAKKFDPKKYLTTVAKVANKHILRDLKLSKQTSVSIKKKYVEFRSPGGDYLKRDISELTHVMLRFARALAIACDPDSHKKEYAKKLFKLSPKGQDNEMTVFQKLMAQYKSGIIDIHEINDEIEKRKRMKKRKK